MKPFLCVWFLMFQFSTSVFQELDYQDVAFVILSQEDPVHEKRALALESDINNQTNFISNVYLSHRDLRHIGDWTVLPLIEKLWNLLEGRFSWIFFCTDQTRINISNLLLCLQGHDSQEVFIGKALQDSTSTIIHHFASIPQFKYPLFASGFGLNYKLVKRFMDVVDKDVFNKVDFSIDSSHELALFLKNNLNGTSLVNNPKFCLNYKKDCATYVAQEDFCEEMNIGKIFFAVKTCKKFHKDRVPVVLKTWGKKVENIAFFSDTLDKDIPTIKLNVPNTESGHCAKTEAIIQIMKRSMTDNDSLKWIILTDDDTILSVRRIQRLVSCYDYNEPYVLGERYGYNVRSGAGFNYITGGGGAALSKGAIMKYTQSSCSCPSESTPDDMLLMGICPQRLNITLVHIPLFHQARPEDYSHEYLKIGDPISFHKHWMTDPVQIYKDWFQKFDFSSSKEVHSEL